MLNINYVGLKKLFPDISYEEEEGVPSVRELTLVSGYKAVCVKYEDETSEICVYDTMIIKIL